MQSPRGMVHSLLEGLYPKRVLCCFLEELEGIAQFPKGAEGTAPYSGYMHPP